MTWKRISAASPWGNKPQPADTSQTAPAAFIAAQHNCAFWDQATHY